MHLIVVPRLMTGRWQCMMQRGTDFHFLIKTDEWSLNKHYERLLIFVCLAYKTHKPNWEARQRLLKNFQRELSRVWNLSLAQRWNVLRKFFLAAQRLCPMQGSMVSQVLQNSSKTRHKRRQNSSTSRRTRTRKYALVC